MEAKQSQPTARRVACSAFWTSEMRGPERNVCQNWRFLSNETAIVPSEKYRNNNSEKFQVQVIHMQSSFPNMRSDTERNANEIPT
jgi:hypothetical protein